MTDNRGGSIKPESGACIEHAGYLGLGVGAQGEEQLVALVSQEVGRLRPLRRRADVLDSTALSGSMPDVCMRLCLIMPSVAIIYVGPGCAASCCGCT